MNKITVSSFIDPKEKCGLNKAVFGFLMLSNTLFLSI